MVDPLITQYEAYNQRRLHYSFLFWACLALHFSGLLLVVFFVHQQTMLSSRLIFGLAGLASLLMAFIAWRLHRLEVSYEGHLRNIEDHWLSSEHHGIQRANITGPISSRKVVILALLCIALGLCCFSIL